MLHAVCGPGGRACLPWTVVAALHCCSRGTCSTCSSRTKQHAGGVNSLAPAWGLCVPLTLTTSAIWICVHGCDLKSVPWLTLRLPGGFTSDADWGVLHSFGCCVV